MDSKKYLDIEGVKYLWSKISMEDYPNNETLIAILKAIDDTKADKSALIPTIKERQEKVITFNGETEGLEASNHYYKVSDDIVSLEDLAGGYIKIGSPDSEETEIALFDDWIRDNYIFPANSFVGYNLNNFALLVHEEAEDKGLTPGIYFEWASWGCVREISYSVAKDVIDPNYISSLFATDAELSNEIQHLEETKANKDQIKQSNWNQSDSTQIDFIKNKPFYDLEQQTILDNISIEISEDGYYDYGHSSPIHGVMIIKSFIEGIKYNLIFNEQTFTVSARHKVFEAEKNEIFYLGNGHLYDNQIEDTHENLVVVVHAQLVNGYTQMACTLHSNLSAGTYNHSIIIPAQSVKIPDKYLNVVIPTTSEPHQQLVTNMDGEVAWEERLGYQTIGEVTFFEESEMYPMAADIHYHYGYNNANEFIIGETYKVNFDGTLYECVAHKDEFHGICLGNMSLTNSTDPVYEDTGEPFLFSYINPGSSIPCQIPNGSIDHYYVVSVVGPAVVTREIPGEYIAGGLYKGSADRSFQVQEAEASQMGAMALGVESVSDAVYAITTGNGTITRNGAAYSIAAGYGTIATAQAQVVHGKYNIEDTEQKYAHIIGNGKRQYGVTTASNAYTLDWDGNGWYQGTVEASAVILRSSTPGSTKKFKLTVDDSGVLSTEELTE